MGSDTDRYITKPLERGLTNTELINWLGNAPPNSEVIVVNRMIVVRWPMASEIPTSGLYIVDDRRPGSSDDYGKDAFPESRLSYFMDFDEEDTNPRAEFR